MHYFHCLERNFLTSFVHRIHLQTDRKFCFLGQSRSFIICIPTLSSEFENGYFWWWSGFQYAEPFIIIRPSLYRIAKCASLLCNIICRVVTQNVLTLKPCDAGLFLLTRLINSMPMGSNNPKHVLWKNLIALRTIANSFWVAWPSSYQNINARSIANT